MECNQVFLMWPKYVKYQYVIQTLNFCKKSTTSKWHSEVWYGSACGLCVASWIFSVEALTTDGWGCFLWSGMKMKLDLTQAWIVVMNRSKWRHSYPHFTSKKRVDLWKQDERILWKSQVTIDLDWQITDYLRTPPILKIFYADRFQATLIKTFLHVA